MEFNISISASPENVWKALWDDASYRRWTSVFAEGSYAESDWNEGSIVKFLTPDQSGMLSRIATKIPNKQMSFLHLGEIVGGVEVLKDWGEMKEEYFLSGSGNATELHVKISDTGNEQMNNYFSKTFPEALKMLKQIAEN